MDWTPLAAFAGLTLLASITPGPAVLLTMAHGLKSGFGASLKAAFGVQAGNGVYFVLSAAGLGAILAASEEVFHAIKWIGAGYLIYLGLRTIAAAGASPTRAREPMLERPFQQAAMGQLANPKSVIFFGALMPQFIQPQAPLLPQYIAFAVLCVVIEVPVARAHLWRSPRGGRSLDRRGSQVAAYFGVAFAVVYRYSFLHAANMAILPAGDARAPPARWQRRPRRRRCTRRTTPRWR